MLFGRAFSACNRAIFSYHPAVLRRFLLLLALVGCGETVPPESPSYGGRGRVGSTRGGAVSVSDDGRIAVVTNRHAGAVSVFQVDPTAPDEDVLAKAPTEVDCGADSEPWVSVIGADDNTAYVVLRRTQKVIRIGNLRKAPAITGEVSVGAEPTAIAISPSGAAVYVANFGEGTISMVDTGELTHVTKLDLNLPLARTGVLGELAGGPNSVWTEADLQRIRPGLAHPRALAMTDSGDDTDADETLYVTEFFSQALPAPETTDVDQSRQGFVFPIGMNDGQVHEPISLPPVTTGFVDAEGSATSCFPNQLYAADVRENLLLVTSMCASPRAPVGSRPCPAPESGFECTWDPNANFKTLVHPTVFAIDRNTNQTVSATVMTRRLEDSYAADTPAAQRRKPLIPNDIVIGPGEGGAGYAAYVTALGADALFRLEYDAALTTTSVGWPLARLVDLGTAAGRLPVGVALARDIVSRAFVSNDFSQTVSLVALDRGAVAAPSARLSSALHGERVDPDVADGRQLFSTGRGSWSLKGEAWSSCESCHPEGGSDGVTWQFARGPRRSISAAGTYAGDDPVRRILLWTANVDEIHDIEAIARGVSGGVGGVLWAYKSEPTADCRLLYDGNTVTGSGNEPCGNPKPAPSRLNGLNGALAPITSLDPADHCQPADLECGVNPSGDWNRIDAFIHSIRAPRAPTTLNADLVRAGAQLFRDAACGACHGGPGWTIARMFYEPGLEENGDVPFKAVLETELDPEGTMLLRMRGELRVKTYEAPTAFRDVDFPVHVPAAAGPAYFRSFAPVDDSDGAALSYLLGTSDQLNCSLRSVGTYPDQTSGAPANTTGVVAPGVLPFSEVRRQLQADTPADGSPKQYVETPAVGATGINIPSLIGLAMGGPYFHAGNARTLEELFDDGTFARHHRNTAFGSGFTATHDNVRALVSYLLSIDDDTLPEIVPSPTTGGLDFDPDLCAAFR